MFLFHAQKNENKYTWLKSPSTFIKMWQPKEIFFINLFYAIIFNVGVALIFLRRATVWVAFFFPSFFLFFFLSEMMLCWYFSKKLSAWTRSAAAASVFVNLPHWKMSNSLSFSLDSFFHARFNGALKKFYFPFQFTRLDLENRVHAVFLNFRITHFVRYSSSVFTNKKLKKLKKSWITKFKQSKWPTQSFWKHFFYKYPLKRCENSINLPYNQDYWLLFKCDSSENNPIFKMKSRIQKGEIKILNNTNETSV